MLGSEVVEHTMEKIQIINTRIKIAQDRQKSYADKRRYKIEFAIDDYVPLRVLPTKGMRRFGILGKLSPRYIRPIEIPEQVGLLAQLSHVHNMFHVSMLRKY